MEIIYMNFFVYFHWWMRKLAREIVAVLVFWVVVEIWCDFGGWEMVMVAIERRNANDGGSLLLSQFLEIQMNDCDKNGERREWVCFILYENDAK
ncbi:hypothetical protein MKX03_010140 [Papaver bracteatum]|nr:hypothetical protein MKX03_010140 [Papaver bracteatum]